VDNQDDTNAAPEDRFLHSTKFILLDRRARLRGVYDGQDPATPDEILAAIRSLLREE
jgi:cytochrome oxidase Cu insertion factor (SCO1/SenC/PrrC family)